MLTLDTLRSEVLNWLDEATNTDTTYTNVTNALNMAQQQRCTEQAWSFMLWRQAETFTTVADQRRYVLHQYLHKPLYFYNRNTKEYLVETPWRQMQGSDVRWLTDTVGNRFVFVESSPLAAQPATATTLVMVSSSASDNTSGKGIIVQGTVSGIPTSETMVPNGITAVTSTNTFDAGSVIAFAKKAAWTGTLTLTDGTNTLLTLPPTELVRSYPQIELLWKPTARQIIEYRFYRKPMELSNDHDLPDLPQAFARLLVWDALLLMAAYDGDMTEARLNVWVDQRDKLMTQLAQTYLDGSTVGADLRYVRDLEDDGSYLPRVET